MSLALSSISPVIPKRGAKKLRPIRVGEVPPARGFQFVGEVHSKGRQMPERQLVVLRSLGKVPAMAGCAKCGRKFFTPADYSIDAVGAYEYLLSKFDPHLCERKREIMIR
jgi:hypothetical protein